MKYFLILKLTLFFCIIGISQDCPSFKEHVKNGNIYLQDNDFNKAINEYNLALQYNENPELFFNLSKACYQLNQYKNALASINKAIDINPTDPNFYFFRANIYVDLNYDYSALNDYTACILLDPNNVYAHMQRAFCFSANGFQEEAIRDMAIAIQIDAEDSKAYFIMAKVTGIISNDNPVCLNLSEMVENNNIHAVLVKSTFCL